MHRHQQTFGKVWKKSLVLSAKLGKAAPAHIALCFYLGAKRREPVACRIEIAAREVSPAYRIWGASAIG